MSRKRLATIIALALALALAASPAAAQDPAEPSGAPASICAVLTEAEVSEALGEQVAQTESYDTSCSWDAFASGGSASLGVSFAPGRLADLAAVYTDATSREIAGHPALVSSDGSFVHAEVDGGILSLYSFFTGDMSPEELAAAMVGLAEAALGRLPSISLPVQPTPEPMPSFVGDPELRDRFPDTVGGQPLEVQTLTFAELFGLADPEDTEGDETLQALLDLLATQGKTFDDLSIGFAYFSTEDASGGVNAVRVRGADMAALVDALLPMFLSDITDLQRTPAQIAGRDVLLVTDGPDGPDVEHQYAYTRDDTLWIVEASEPQLSEIIGQLP
jgi:hypothetical protein